MEFADAYRIGLAICGAYRLVRGRTTASAHTIAGAMIQAPPEHRQAVAHRTARTLLAEQWDLPTWSLPPEPGRCQAIGRYEDARDRCRNVEEEAAFDLHSMHYAIENGVCPRCANPGRFGHTFGVCPCGYGYGHPEPAEDGEEPTCTGKATPRRAVVRLVARW